MATSDSMLSWEPKLLFESEPSLGIGPSWSSDFAGASVGWPNSEHAGLLARLRTLVGGGACRAPSAPTSVRASLEWLGVGHLEGVCPQ